jgi:O-antigen/teichoic acid export membrane protein
MLTGLLLFNAWLSWSTPSWLPSEAQRPLLIAGNGLLLAIPLKLFTQALVANFDVDFIAVVTATSSIVSAVASLIVVRFGFGLVGLAWVWGVSQVAVGGIGTVRFVRKYPEAIPTWTQVWRATSALGRRNLWVVLGQVCHTILNATDTILVGRVLGPLHASVYNCTDRVLTVAASLPGSATEAAGPFLAHANARDPARMRSAAFAFTLSVLCAAGWIAACVTATNGAFVKIWVGPELFGGVRLTALLGLGFVMNQMGGALVQLVFYLGNVRVGTIAGVVSSLLFLGLAYLLLPRLGMLGAPLALCISVGSGALPFLLGSLWATTNGFDGWGRLLPGWILRFALLMAAATAVGAWGSGRGLGAIVVGVFLVTLLTIALLGGYIYREPLRSLVRDRLVAHRWGGLIEPVLKALEMPAMASHRPFLRLWAAK